MSTTLPPQIPVGSAHALARRLRESPDLAQQPVTQLALEFELEEAFVAEVLRGLRDSQPHSHPDRTRRLRSVVGRAATAVARLPVPPLLFISASAIAGGAAIYWVGRNVPSSSRPGYINACIILGLLLTHLLCYYRDAKPKTVLRGSVAVWLILAAGMVGATWLERPSDPLTLERTLMLVLVALPVAFAYGALGFMSAILGAFRTMRKRERLSERLSRQELLQRLFALRDRLQNPHRGTPERFVPAAVYSWYGKHPWLYAALLGAGLAGMNLTAMAFMDYTPSSRQAPPLMWLVLNLIMMASGLFSYFAVGFLSQTPIRAVGRGLVMALSSLLVTQSGLYGDRVAWMRDTRDTWGIAVNLLIVVALALVASMASRVEEASLRERRLQAQDPAALLAEIVKIEWRLSQGASEVCVVVVDAARSAEMKASGDALDAEYSFREYQRMLANRAKEHGGEVHSTAGDGAVLTFKCAEDAFAAARSIQCDIDKFNRDVNRLETPFRLRIGMHMGEVPGDIDEVQFTHVIDIAAHVQGKAPVGGILVTQSAAARLAGESFAPLADAIDGHPVLLALDPTGCG